MMKTSFFVLFTTLFINVIGQNQMSYSFEVEPLITSTILSKSDDLNLIFATTDEYISQRENIDKSKVGIKFELGLNYKISNHITSLIRISFLNQNLIQGKYYPTYTYPLFRTYEVQKSNVTFNYLGIPIGIKFEIYSKDKLLIGLECSLTTKYLISTTNSDESLEGVFPATENKNFVLDGNLGIYFTCSLTDNCFMELKPDFGIAITPTLIELSSVKQRNYYIGLCFGLKMNK